MLLLTIDVDILSNITLNKFKQFNFASLSFDLICVTNYSVFYCQCTYGTCSSFRFLFCTGAFLTFSKILLQFLNYKYIIYIS